ncbi:MAG: hypothetical protein ACYCZY_09425 [Lacisediminihabitans sp.]
MKRVAVLTTVLTAVLTLVLPFVGGGGPSFASSRAAAYAADNAMPIFASPVAAVSAPQAVPSAAAASVHLGETALASAGAQRAAALTVDTEHLAQRPVPQPVPVPVPAAAAARAAGGSTAARRVAQAAAGSTCPGPVGGATGGAPSRTSAGGVPGTTSGDLASFAATYNAIRVANCLEPVPMSHIRYDACMETRLFWMAEDPSTDPMSAWGHLGSVRSDGVPSVGCDGNLAGGSGNTGATVAQKWWDSLPHRASLYRPTFAGSTGNVCINFAMTHGGLVGTSLGEPYSFTRAAARWVAC